MDISTVISTCIGGFLTIFFAIVFYLIGSHDLRKIVKELRKETEEIKRQNRIALGYVERAGLVKVHRGSNGEILEPVKTATISDFHVL